MVDKEVLRDRPLGTYKGTLADYDFETTPKHEDVVKQLRDAKSEGKDKSRGEVRFDVAYYPVPTAPAIGAAAELVSSYEATHGSSQSGILRVTIHQAKELDTSKAVAGQLSAFVELQYNKVFMGKTPVKKRSNVPYWEWSNELFIRNAVIDRVRFTIRDQRDLLHDTELGYCELTLREILKMLKAPATVPRREWWTVRGSATGKMRLSFTWTPIGFDHIVPPLSVGGKAPLVPAMGVVRLRVIEAKALANKEAV